jgi:hypothetical protein
MASPAISQLAQQGGQLGMGMVQEKRMRDIFNLENDKFQQEQQAASEIGQVYQEENDLLRSRSQGAQVFAQLRNLAGQPTSVRKTTAPVVFQAIEKAIDAPLADNLKQLILSGKPEEVGPLMDRIIRAYAQDPNQTLESSKGFLTSPIASAQAIGGLSRQMMTQAQNESLTGPTPAPRQDKMLAEKVKRQRLIDKLEAVASRRSNTEAGKVAFQKAQQLREELSKMETVMSSQEANAQGIPVRPGTTVTENGMGNVAVLQGPDDSGSGGSGPGGLKASDERFLKQMAASEFDTEVNLQTGDIKFKNRAEADIANRRTATAARIFADAGGKLTLSEAYQEAKKREGAGAAPQGNIYDQFTPGG